MHGFPRPALLSDRAYTLPSLCAHTLARLYARPKRQRCIVDTSDCIILMTFSTGEIRAGGLRGALRLAGIRVPGKQGRVRDALGQATRSRA